MNTVAMIAGYLVLGGLSLAILIALCVAGADALSGGLAFNGARHSIYERLAALEAKVNTEKGKVKKDGK